VSSFTPHCLLKETLRLRHPNQFYAEEGEEPLPERLMIDHVPSEDDQAGPDDQLGHPPLRQRYPTSPKRRPYKLFPEEEANWTLEPSYDVAIISHGIEQIKSLNATFFASKEILHFGKELFPLMKDTFAAVENKELKAIVVLLALVVLLVFYQLKVSQKKPMAINNSFPCRMLEMSRHLVVAATLVVTTLAPSLRPWTPVASPWR